MNRLLGDIGTIEWSRRTRGLMSPAEQLRYMTATLLETARSLPRLALAHAGLWKGGPDPAVFTIPDTAFARAVESACAELEPMLLEHSLRAYLFARALASVEREQVDDEALFAAAMFHDAAFPALEDAADDRCFGLRGAERAEALLRGSPLSAALQHDVLDAITLHLNPYVTREQGSLQRLLHDGVLLDVLGLRAWELDREGVARVQERHPRHGFLHAGPARFRAHARRVPRARAHAALRCGFATAMQIGLFYGEDRRSLRLGADARTHAEPS